MDTLCGQEPSTKRLKLSDDSYSSIHPSDSLSRPRLCRVILEEIDVEIGLRMLLMSTLESRLKWASLLHTSFANDPDGLPSCPPEATGSSQYPLDSYEAPCSFLFSQDPYPRHSSRPSHCYYSESDFSQHNLVQPSSRGTSRDKHPPRHQHIPKLLYICDHSSSTSSVAKLACVDCFRSDFTNMQGLLNHCRLRHGRTFGSHDECMRSCAVAVLDEVEKNSILAHGIEVGGTYLPDLKGLFQAAVGQTVDFGLGGASPDHGVDGSPPNTDQALHLTKTLGHHRETPALAPFLGRQRQRRRIHVMEEEGSLDIGSLNVTQDGSVAGWRKAYTHRNLPSTIHDQGDGVTDHDGLEKAIILRPHYTPSGTESNATRFHLLARVSVEDRSLLIPSDQRSSFPDGHTHRWFISVGCPSYSLHVTTFLEKVTITCLTEPLQSTMREPVVVQGPPFLASGTTDMPFLARVTFHFVGENNAAIDIEHWVDLYPFKTVNPVLGDVQMRDLEIDRSTPLLPAQADVDWKAWRQTVSELRAETDSFVSRDQDNAQERYHVVLESLLQSVPMTLKDLPVGKSEQNFHYKLMASPLALLRSTFGRRKAIEWARATTLREEYRRAVASDRDALPLTTGDVYRWLEDHGHFPRNASDGRGFLTNPSTKKAPLPGNNFFHCAACGDSHGGQAFGLQVPEVEFTPSAPVMCAQGVKLLTQMPVLDLASLLRARSNRHAENLLPPLSSTPSSARYTARDLLTSVDPALTTAVAGLLHKNAALGVASPDHSAPVGSENDLASSALLALLSRAFLGNLVRTGVGALSDARVQPSGSRRAKVKSSLLAPSHILWALSNDGVRGKSGPLVRRCLSRLQVRVEADTVASPKIRVKIEED